MRQGETNTDCTDAHIVHALTKLSWRGRQGFFQLQSVRSQQPQQLFVHKNGSNSSPLPQRALTQGTGASKTTFQYFHP